MMTAENNANRMLTKVSVLVVSVGLVACSYRTYDKTSLHARTTISEPVAVTGDKSRENPSHVDKVTTVQSASTSLTEIVQARSKPNTASEDGLETRAEISIRRVVGDASVSLSFSSSADETLSSDVHQVDMRDDASLSPRIAEAVASNEKEAPSTQLAWLLAIVALIAAGGVGFGLARYRQRRATVRHEMNNEVGTQGAANDAGQEATQTTHLAVVDHEVSKISEPAADDDKLSSLVEVATDAWRFSRLEWSYQPPDYEMPEHWEIPSPVDFLPLSLSTQAAYDSIESSSVIDAEVEEVSIEMESESVVVTMPHFGDDPLSQLFDQMERVALPESGDLPVLLIERGSDLPEVICTTDEAVPSEVLQAWERIVRHALPNAQTLTLPWLLISTLLLRADNASSQEAESLYAEAEEWIELSMASDLERAAWWKARQIDIDLRRVKRKKGAERLLSLRTMQSHYAQQIAESESPLLFAWIDVLMFWAQCQFGNAALARYTEAEALCLRLCERPASADTAQRRRAEILRQRATIEEGGARLTSLDAAQSLLDALYERVPSADNALAVAITALARGNVLPPEQAEDAYSHALIHAFMAEGEPRLKAEGMQCRLAVQWAYENLPGMTVQSDVAIGLTAKLEALHVQQPETVQRMAQIHLRNADFAHACELCENAWRNGRATPALLVTWQEAYRQWAAASVPPGQITARQNTMRQLSIASAMR